MHLGLPSPIDSDIDFAAIQTFLRQNAVPPYFATRVRVQLVVAKFTSLLSHDIGDAASSSLIRLLDTELDALKPDGFGDPEYSRAAELCILDAKMHFYTLFITKFPHSAASRQIMLRTAFTAALRIIRISTSEWRDFPESRTDPSFVQRQKSLHKNHYRSLALATIFLLRFFHRSDAASAEEQQLAANHISLAGEHFKALSTAPRDEYIRTAKMFEILARMPLSAVEPSKMRLTHRMGVSIVLDAVTNATEVRGQQVEMDDDDRPAPSENQTDPAIFQTNFEVPYYSGQSGSDEDILRELWNDPFLSMLNFEPMSPMGEY